MTDKWTMSDEPTTAAGHKRRSPCCEAEARRYLNESTNKPRPFGVFAESVIASLEYLMEEHGTRSIGIDDLRAVLREEAAAFQATEPADPQLAAEQAKVARLREWYDNPPRTYNKIDNAKYGYDVARREIELWVLAETADAAPTEAPATTLTGEDLEWAIERGFIKGPTEAPDADGAPTP